MSNAFANGFAGAGGGIIAQIITYPLQSVNTRQQTERIAKKKLSPPPTSAASPPAGTLIQLIHVIRTEGWGGLYSGLRPSLLGTAASQGIYYYFYQVFKNRAEAAAVARKKRGVGDGTVGMFSWLVVAAIAGSLNVLLTNPIWVLVTRMQSRLQAKQEIGGNVASRYTGTLDAIMKMIRYEGLPGFYKGMSTKIVQSVFAASVLFMVKEELVKAYLFLAEESKRILSNYGK